MSIANFVPTVWAEGIERELERACVFAEDCNRQYEGDVKKQGDSVRILGVGRPTITTITKQEKNGLKIGDPEAIPTSAITMYINQLSWFNYGIDDIDKAQASGDIMGAFKAETTEALANEVDKHIAAQVADSTVPKLFASAMKVVSGEAAASTEMNVLDILDLAIQKLQENDIADSTPIVVTVSPRFYRVLKKDWRETDTDNTGVLKHGKVGMYGNVTIKRSNNVYKTEGGAVDNIMIRTKRAVAYAQPLTETKAYEPEQSFGDAVKGFILYQAKVVRPKEIFNINVKYA